MATFRQIPPNVSGTIAPDAVYVGRYDDSSLDAKPIEATFPDVNRVVTIVDGQEVVRVRSLCGNYDLVMRTGPARIIDWPAEMQYPGRATSRPVERTYDPGGNVNNEKPAMAPSDRAVFDALQAIWQALQAIDASGSQSLRHHHVAPVEDALTRLEDAFVDNHRRGRIHTSPGEKW